MKDESIDTRLARVKRERDKAAEQIRLLERALRARTQLWRSKCIEYRFLCELEQSSDAPR